jgi:type II secretory pathway pseudopilin PulG
MVELLLVVVIIGVLAAIALPSLTSQRSKGQDAVAKSLVRHGALAMQSYGSENDGYAATRAELLDLAPELDEARSWTLISSAAGYTLSVTAPSDHVFSYERALTGVALRTCSSSPDAPGNGGCSSAGTW